ncbi:hypothetical protein [Falsiroseomonas tokyonensis]|uniref:Carbonic anhydrase n=1 Tax=Falsiroseomonas tokyonensis TaxID=430521 RepID=A0ABV7BR90_9PROT|nr:hypothetical protein [Falsiroseomonas tokyonensis]MBU8536956.1 hypothetical protein [Falsiroseomonas tokyonensis]
MTQAPHGPPSKADAFVVGCIDPRLVDDLTVLMDAVGRTDRYAEFRIAGAALAAVDSNRPAWGQALWENLAASRQLHGVRKVVFVNHRDCGAMDLFAGRRLSLDPADELRQHQAVLDQAAAAVLARHPDMQVELRLMELDGRSTLLPCAACAGFPQAGRAPLRAEAVSPVQPTSAVPPAYAELLRLRLRDGPLAPEAERDLLAEGVTRHGLTAEAARAALAAAASERGQATGAAAAREVAVYLRSRADARGRVARTDLARASALYRRLSGSLPTAEADRRTALLLEAEGLSPRPEGLWRSTSWFDRLVRAPAPRPA